MNEQHHFSFSIEPRPKGRHRSFVRHNRMMHIPDPQTKVFETSIKTIAQLKWGSREMLLGPIRMTLLFNLSKPPKGKKGSKMKEPATTPDLDNLIKAVTDALNRIAYRDDAQICEISAKKVYVEKNPGIEVWFEEYKGEKECHLKSLV
jgi:Holliday junction resolvase RusA-like endonuclease